MLAYYGIFAPSGFLGQSVRGFTTVVILQPWSFNVGGVLQANIENRVGQPMNITAIYIIPSSGTGGVANTTNHTFTTAQKQIISASGFSSVVTTGSKTGDTFTYTVAIEYTTDGTSKFNSTGTVSGTFS